MSPSTSVWVAVLVLLAAPAAALDCSSPTTLECGVTSTGISIGSGAVAADPQWCNSTFTANSFAHIFEFTLASASEVVVSSTSPLMTLFLLNSCDQDDCVANATGQGTPSVTACLPAGTYLVGGSTPTDAIFTYQMGLTCAACDPVVSVGAALWGNFKKHYQ